MFGVMGVVAGSMRWMAKGKSCSRSMRVQLIISFMQLKQQKIDEVEARGSYDVYKLPKYTL